MEDAVLDLETFLTHIFAFAGMETIEMPDIDQFKFQRFTGRRVGDIDPSSHYRSGDPEGWRRELSRSAIDYIRAEFRPFLEIYYPDALRD
jgi:hypothetical protein